MRSLRNRLVVATLVAMLLILLVAASAIYGMIRRALLAEFDETLLTKARAITSVAEQDDVRFELDLEAVQMPEFEPGERPEYFQIWSSENSVLARSSTLSGQSLEAGGATKMPSYRYGVLPDGRPGRQVTFVTPIRIDHGDDEDEDEEEQDNDDDEQMGADSQVIVTICVARDTLDLDQTLRGLGWLLGSVSLGAALLSVLILIVVVSFTLKPVGAFAAQISEIDASNVSENDQLTCSIEELDPVVHRLNEFLERLEKAFAREKAFTADVAHELRTPLAGLSAALEVCASRPRDEAAYKEVIQKCLGTTRAMQSMVENLLTLARADAGQLTLQNKPLDLLSFAADCWRPFEEHATKRGLHVQWPDDAQPIDVVTDREKLRLVLSNIFDNAVRHSDQGGTVTVEAAGDPKEAVFEVRNTGCDLPPDAVERVFERFWIHDTARTEGAEHCGLGLPLCRRIVTALGGSISATLEQGSFAVRLRLPLGTKAKEKSAGELARGPRP